MNVAKRNTYVWDEDLELDNDIIVRCDRCQYSMDVRQRISSGRNTMKILSGMRMVVWRITRRRKWRIYNAIVKTVMRVTEDDKSISRDGCGYVGESWRNRINNGKINETMKTTQDKREKPESRMWLKWIWRRRSRKEEKDVENRGEKNMFQHFPWGNNKMF